MAACVRRTRLRAPFCRPPTFPGMRTAGARPMTLRGISGSTAFRTMRRCARRRPARAICLPSPRWGRPLASSRSCACSMTPRSRSGIGCPRRALQGRATVQAAIRARGPAAGSPTTTCLWRPAPAAMSSCSRPAARPIPTAARPSTSPRGCCTTSERTGRCTSACSQARTRKTSPAACCVAISAISQRKSTLRRASSGRVSMAWSPT